MKQRRALAALQSGEVERGGVLSLLRAFLTLVLLGAALAARADDSATAMYAGAQLRLAQSELDGARAALHAHDYARARQLAAQAQLDCRLAWAMSDSHAVRRAAVELNLQAERLRWQGLVAAGAAR